MTIGDNIRIARESALLNQRECSEKSGISRSYISRIEGCNMLPTLGILEKIAEATGSTVHDLLSGDVILNDPFMAEIAPLALEIPVKYRKLLMEVIRQQSEPKLSKRRMYKLKGENI
jgi:transcriptional regulator with XRE-family HTH domain